MERRLTQVLVIAAMVASAIGAGPVAAASPGGRRVAAPVGGHAAPVGDHAVAVPLDLQHAPALVDGEKALVSFGTKGSPGVRPGTVGFDLPAQINVVDTSGSCTAPVFASCDHPTGQVELSLTGDATGTVHLGEYYLHVGGDDYGVLHWDGYPPVPAGTYVLAAEYSGDGTFGSYTGTTSVTIKPASPYVTEHQSSSSSGLGDAVTFTACICGLSDDHGQPKPTGTVQFKVDGKPLGSRVAVTPGGTSGIQAVLTTTELPLGTTYVDAYYSGDASYRPAHTPGGVAHRVTASMGCLPNCQAGPTAPIQTIGTIITPITATKPPGGTTLSLGCLPQCLTLTAVSPSLPPAVSTTSTPHTPVTTGTSPGPPGSTPPAPHTTAAHSTGVAAPPDAGGAPGPSSHGASDSAGQVSSGEAGAGGDAAASGAAGGDAAASGAAGGATSAAASASGAGATSAAAGSTAPPTGQGAGPSSGPDGAGSASGSAVVALAGGQPRPANAGQSDTGFLRSHIWLLVVIVALLLLAAIAVYVVLRRRRPDEQVQ